MDKHTHKGAYARLTRIRGVCILARSRQSRGADLCELRANDCTVTDIESKLDWDEQEDMEDM